MYWTSNAGYVGPRGLQIEARREVFNLIIATAIFFTILVVLASGIARTMKPGVAVFAGAENAMASAVTFDRILIDRPVSSSEQ